MANFDTQTKWFGEDQPNNTNSATIDIGSGGDGTVTTEVDDYGTEGNDYTIEVEEGSDGGALAAVLTDTSIVVTLGMSSDTAATNLVSAVADILTINALPTSLGVSANALDVVLATAADDNLAVSADGAIITIELANATATKNTAALIQTAIRALTTVDGVDVTAFTCSAAGNWDTVAIETGESGAVDFTGGVDSVAATNVVEAASAVSDTLTTNALPSSLGVSANALDINLVTAADDNLVVSALGSVITIALADTTATKNTAALIQVGIRALTTVATVDVTAFTCAAGGNWDTAAIATGESGIVNFSGGINAVAATNSVSAVANTLTTNALPASLGASANVLDIVLETAGDDNLAVSAVAEVITIALADTTASKNTAALIQVEIRALATVDGIDVSAFTCVAGGNWDTVAIETGEVGAVDFTGGVTSAPDDAKNTATLVAAAIDALDDVSATASGSGATALDSVEAEQSFAGGTYGTLAPVPFTMLFIAPYYYTNILVNGKDDSNWRRFQLSSY